ncbi:MAG: hypothetical protein H9993_03385 [Candidatus Desulfovibrio faecigallinarum]|nr:hypothetical protein [Candidatus Desulfovibrio faecigallinarum]
MDEKRNQVFEHVVAPEAESLPAAKVAAFGLVPRTRRGRFIVDPLAPFFQLPEKYLLTVLNITLFLQIANTSGIWVLPLDKACGKGQPA